jgi:hypothetical protein
MNPRWSASRVSTYKSCKLKYKTTYIDEFVATGGTDADVTQKGLSIHEIAEWYDSSKSYDELVAFAQSHLDKADFDQEKYPVIKAMPRFYQFWEKNVRALEALGFTLTKENWEHFEINNAKFVGALDVLLINPSTNEVRIFDYKSGKKAAINDDYRTQLLIYCLAIGQRLKMTPAEIVKNVKCYLFFPLAGITDEESDSAIASKMMLKSLKELKYKEQDLRDVTEELTKIIDASNAEDWSTVDGMSGSLSYACGWCPFAGGLKSQASHDSFTPCELSYKQGLRSSRGVKYVLKSELKTS